jgi:hypothetical protein
LLRVAVIDGQGGGIGSTVIKKMKEQYRESIDVWALGTNAIATSQMMKAGANRGATGESAICHCLPQVNVVVGPVSILVAHAMMGELTPAAASAVGASTALKLLLPLTQEPVTVVGAIREPLPHLVDRLLQEHLAPLVETESSP